MDNMRYVSPNLNTTDGVLIDRIEKMENGKLLVTFKDNKKAEEEYDSVVFAVTREPQTSALN
jgi:pyruvate/2-oxoglutarate dehydrogenase complex dihydrolipoamide dehydrogenase (E3) component